MIESNDKKNKEKDGNVSLSFTIGDMPLSQFSRFKKLAKCEFGNCYWMTIVHLIDIKEAHSLINRDLAEIKANQDMIADIIENKKETINEGVKTFGGELK